MIIKHVFSFVSSNLLLLYLFFLMIRRPPRFSLFPYAAPFRSRSRGTGALRPRPLRPGCSSTRPSRCCHRAGSCRHRRRRSEEHTSELQSRQYLVCRLLLEKKSSLVPSLV